MLTDLQKTALYLREIENLTLQEIADRLNSNIVAIRSLVKAAQKRRDLDEKYAHIKGIG